MTSKASLSPIPSEVVTIEKVVAGGYGLARGEQGTLLVAGTLAGEQVRVRRLQAGKPHAGLLEQLTESPQRTKALSLPTADLSHAAYPEQLRIKRGLVTEALERIGGLKDAEAKVSDTVPSPKALAYRHAAQYLVTTRGLAYRERGSHSPTVLREDPLVSDPIHALLERVVAADLLPARELALRSSEHSGQVLACLIGSGAGERYAGAARALRRAGAVGVSLAAPAGRRFSGTVTPLWGQQSLPERFGALLGGVSASSFAQGNPQAAGLLYEKAADLAGKHAPPERALDLYGGTGLLARHLLRRWTEAQARVIDASEAALKQGKADWEGESGDTAQSTARLSFGLLKASHLEAEHLRGFDTVLADPPRAGLSPEVRAALLASEVSSFVYVSCDPATWARDISALGGTYRLEAAIPFDFYPQTSHVEVLSLLQRTR